MQLTDHMTHSAGHGFPAGPACCVQRAPDCPAWPMQRVSAPALALHTILATWGLSGTCCIQHAVWSWGWSGANAAPVVGLEQVWIHWTSPAHRFWPKGPAYGSSLAHGLALGHPPIPGRFEALLEVKDHKVRFI